MRRSRGREVKILSLAAFFIIALLSMVELPQFADGGAEFYAFDVGQGDAALFRFPDGSNMLVDAGPRKSAESLVAKLRRAGVRRIDILVATHPHEDHIGGMELVLRSFPVGKVWDSGYNHGSGVQRSMLALVRDLGIRYGRPRPGFKEEHGGATVEVIAPIAPISGAESDANNNSIVLLVSYGEVSFLMMGDMEEAGRRAVENFPAAAILKAAHHGSRNGTDRRLLEQTRPLTAILTYGSGNSYGHPHGEVRELLGEFGVKSYATADGDITIRIEGDTYRVSQERAR
ncbi:MAG: MBL fold metallo-hydrolase [Synergistaceae bacterium]|jgi:competence protein ComEC|nr:MBL fold metallo-hydrolase [Synergistaceae bacterium]